MARYQILYWRGIPAQVKAWDDIDEVKREMPPRFTARIDREAQALGLTMTDDYLAQWRWGEELDREGEVQDVVDIIIHELETSYPQ